MAEDIDGALVGLARRQGISEMPVPVVRRRGGVLGTGPDRPAAAGHRRGRPGRGRGGQAGGGPGRFVPDPGERAYTGLQVARLLRVAFAGDSGGPLSREELFAGWRLFFERLAAVEPVVLVVEDAQ